MLWDKCCIVVGDIYMFKLFAHIFLLASLMLAPQETIEKWTDEGQSYAGFHKSDFVVIEEYDDRGFHGDGIYSLVLDCSENTDVAMEIVAEWKELPLSEELSLMMYGGKCGNTFYCYDYAEKANIPEVENGYYYYCDRYRLEKNDGDALNSPEQISPNFTIVIYDADTDDLYYLEVDM